MPVPRIVTCMATFLCAALIYGENLYAVDPLNHDALVQSLDELIDNHPTAERTTVTLKVVDLETGEVLYDRGGDKLLIPASNLKIYTAAAALDILGPDFQWMTGVAVDGTFDKGVVNGDLVIRGDGDPMLDTGQLAAIADAVVNEHKVKQVHGRVRAGTMPLWADVPLKGPGWMWDDDPAYFNMSIRQVMLNFNTLTVEVSHGEAAPVIKLEPATDWPPVVIEHRESMEPGQVIVTRKPFEEVIRVAGNPAADAEPVRHTVTMHDPSLWVASVFTRMLADRGVVFHAVDRPGDSQRKGYFYGSNLATSKSKTLAEAVKHFLRVSENAVGEMLLLKIAEARTYGDVSWRGGSNIISLWLTRTAGLEEGSFRLVDGSGLSRYNLISADSAVKLLAYMKTHKHFEPFYDGLNEYEVAFPEGEKWGGVPLAEFDPQRVGAKSGGMSGVATLSGYIQTLDGRTLVFSFLANGYTGGNKPVMELRNAVWPVLVRYRPADVVAEKPVAP